MTALVRKWSAEAGIPQRQISAEEIVERCIYALVNEGARIRRLAEEKNPFADFDKEQVAAAQEILGTL